MLVEAEDHDYHRYSSCFFYIFWVSWDSSCFSARTWLMFLLHLREGAQALSFLICRRRCKGRGHKSQKALHTLIACVLIASSEIMCFHASFSLSQNPVVCVPLLTSKCAWPPLKDSATFWGVSHLWKIRCSVCIESENNTSVLLCKIICNKLLSTEAEEGRRYIHLQHFHFITNLLWLYFAWVFPFFKAPLQFKGKLCRFYSI